MKKLMVVAIVILAATTLSMAQEIQKMELESAITCTGVENRDPVEPGDTFSSDIGHVWCHTKFVDVPEDTNVKHVWYHGDVERASIQLKVGKSIYWRTWSCKTIMKHWTGEWHIDIVDENENIIETVSFTVSE